MMIVKTAARQPSRCGSEGIASFGLSGRMIPAFPHPALRPGERVGVRGKKLSGQHPDPNFDLRASFPAQKLKIEN
jgi:hypothetical protein